MDYRSATLKEWAGRVARGELSAEALMASTLDRIEQLNPALSAFTELRPREMVLAEARAVDEARSRGESLSPLAGMPLGVKDLEDAAGLLSTFGSALFGQTPATEDSILVSRLKQAGAIVVGKTMTPEFGCKGVTNNPRQGVCRNPFALERSPGGSSGGSSAALAAGLVPLATGSDGGGSIRIPSAFSGHSGFKASQGRLPLGDALPPTTGTLAVRGPMTYGMDEVSGADYARAMDQCTILAMALEATLERHGASLLLGATCPCLPPEHDAPGIVLGRQTGRWVEMTLPMNMTRMPAATVAAGLGTEGNGPALPVGLQVLGGQHQDAAVLSGALALERILGGPLRADLAAFS